MLQALHLQLNENVDILWNVSFEDPILNSKSKCVLLY